VGQEKRELLANALVKSALRHQVIGRIPSSDSERLNNEGGQKRGYSPLYWSRFNPDST